MSPIRALACAAAVLLPLTAGCSSTAPKPATLSADARSDVAALRHVVASVHWPEGASGIAGALADGGTPAHACAKAGTHSETVVVSANLVGADAPYDPRTAEPLLPALRAAGYHVGSFAPGARPGERAARGTTPGGRTLLVVDHRDGVEVMAGTACAAGKPLEATDTFSLTRPARP